jgi:hypothetical protein
MPVRVSNRGIHEAFKVLFPYIVGTHRGDDNFVGHVGISERDAELQGPTELLVSHMSPPLWHGHMRADVIAYLGDLSTDELYRMQTWQATVFPAISPPSGRISRWRDYIVHPPYFCKPAEKPGRSVKWMFSCVGWVLASYELGCRVKVLSWEDNALPQVSPELLQAAYEIDASGQDSRLLAERGLPPPGPWRIVLPGYLFHAFARGDAAVRKHPYCPATMDESYYPMEAESWWRRLWTRVRSFWT